MFQSPLSRASTWRDTDLCNGHAGCGNQSLSSDQRSRFGEEHRSRVHLHPRRTVDLRRPRRVPPPQRSPRSAGAALLRTADYQDYLTRRWRGPDEEMSARPDALTALRHRTLLHLGESDALGTLLAVLPRGYSPMTDPDDMLTELVPDYIGADSWSEPLLRAEADVYRFGEPMRGLFWSGLPDCPSAAWTHAVLGARGRGGAPVFVGPLPAKLSRDLGPDRSELRVDRQGRVSVAQAASLLTWTHDGGVHVAERGRTRLALADYYLWWAHRLHSYAHEVSGSGLDLHLAERAARRGLRELGRLSKVVEHLDEHLAAEAEEEG